MTEAIGVAFSPCPNDTFVFHAWAHGLIPDAPELDVTFADIEITNHWAEERRLPLLKISAAAMPWAQRAGYTLLPAGGAVGRGCGPLVLVRGDDERDAASLATGTLAIPSDRSTAFLLASRWARDAVPGGFGNVVVMPFPEIMPAVERGDIDAGLVIHEARFTYQDHGLKALVDLGEWWERTTGLPIALGAIVARDDLIEQYGVEQLTDWLRASVDYAWADPSASRAYIAANAQEMSPDVQQRHIDLYVNEFTRDLGSEGEAALHALLSAR